MTAEWITKAAEERWPDDMGTGSTSWMPDVRWPSAAAMERRAAFIAGVELGLAKAAAFNEIDAFMGKIGNPDIDPEFKRGWTAHADAAGHAIRALGSDENGETT